MVPSSLWEQKEDQRPWLVSTGTGWFGQKGNRRPMVTQKLAALLASAAGALTVPLKAGVPSVWGLQDQQVPPEPPPRRGRRRRQRRQERAFSRLPGYGHKLPACLPCPD